ncbi:PREDICTED: protein GLUTAMINE DUMPER 3-like [Tarenaya hassleriana]|uniref:protein GLUTAMINE DUMPER 3-like n=1 Tax=Tarenaya hassleriana TaxID=28532 RepID=UPI00053C542B|nr:PREDICTED: protein GLUTAMINE DUMPER 3-like [Tarenaya hassleriana]
MDLQTNRTALGSAYLPLRYPMADLFCGLGAMLCLIVIAVLIRHSGYLDDNPTEESDLESGDDTEAKQTPVDMPEKCLVVMAGEVKPTYLPTPASTGSNGEPTPVQIR